MLVEDEPDIAEVVQYNLVKEGYQVEVHGRGDTALEAVRRKPPDLILLDLMLPGLDGLEMTRLLKRDGATAHVPLVMLTAKGEEVDRIVGLELGADDYLTKPFNPRELVARIKALLRRSSRSADESIAIHFADLTVDPARQEVTVSGQPVPLRTQEFDLLLAFARHKGLVLSREQLLQLAWGY